MPLKGRRFGDTHQQNAIAELISTQISPPATEIAHFIGAFPIIRGAVGIKAAPVGMKSFQSQLPPHSHLRVATAPPGFGLPRATVSTEIVPESTPSTVPPQTTRLSPESSWEYNFYRTPSNFSSLLPRSTVVHRYRTVNSSSSCSTSIWPLTICTNGEISFNFEDFNLKNRIILWISNTFAHSFL